MLNFLKAMFGIKKSGFVSSALLDTRPQEQKDKNFFDIEFSMGDDEYEWKEETPEINNQVNTFYPYHQFTSLSCVSLWIALAIETFWRNVGKIFIGSRRDAYRRRFNFPNGGMAMYDIIKIGKEGIASESQVPSQDLGEAAMNASYPVTQEILDTRKKNRIKDGIYIKNFKNIDNLAKASKLSAVCIFVYFDPYLEYQEFWRQFPQVVNQKLDLYASNTLRHQVSGIGLIVLGGVLIDGKKYLRIQDSAGKGTGLGKNKNIRYLSEDFVSKRVYEAAYAIPEDFMVPQPPSDKPKWTGKRNLKTTMSGEDVKEWQKILQYHGCFDYPNPTGYFGGITRMGTIKLQNKFADEILKPVGLKHGTGNVFESTRKWAEKYHG